MELNYEKDVSIDKYDLDNEVVKQPELFSRWIAKLPEAIFLRDKAKQAVDVVYASLDKEIRIKTKGEKITEAAIRNEIITNSIYQETQEKYFMSREDADQIQGAIQSFEQRKSMIEVLIKLYLSGYYSDVRPAQTKEHEADVIVKKITEKSRRGGK